MLRKDIGVVLQSGRSGETSTLCTFLGRQSGKVKLLGKGALGSKSPFRGLLEPGNTLEVVYYHKEGRTLFFLKEAHLQANLGAVRKSLPHLACALALLDLAGQVCYWGNPEAGVVDLVEDYLQCVATGDPLYLYIACGYKLLEVLGNVPDFVSCATCRRPLGSGYFHPAEGISLCRTHTFDSPERVRLDESVLQALRAIRSGSLLQAARADVNRNLRKRLGQILHWTYTFHVQGYRLPQALKLVPKGDP